MKLLNKLGIRSKTFLHFFKLISSGRFIELGKVVRRRLLNLFKFIRRILSHLYGIYYHNPVIERRRNQKRLKQLLDKHYGFSEARSNGKLRLALIAQGATTYPFSSFFIRLVSPLTDDQIKSKVSLQLLPNNTTKVPEGTQVCIVQRTAYDNVELAKQLVSSLKQIDCALVVDSDDAFHIIDKNHPEHATHKNKLDAFDFLLSQADQVWLSTEKLVESLAPYSRHKPKLVENSLDPRLWPTLSNPVRTNSGNLRFVYMGTVSHEADLALVMPALKNLAQKYPGSFSLDVMGVTPDPIEYPWAKRIYQKRNGSIYPKFIKWFQAQGPFDLGLAPLVNTEFNNNKSDIKALDYLAAGIVPMVSDVEAYKTAGLEPMLIKVSNSVEEWQKSLEKIIQDREAFREDAKQRLKLAQQYIIKERSSAVTSAKLYAYLTALISKSR